LASGVVAAAFVPSAAVPEDVPVLWETTFLAPKWKRPAMFLVVLGALGLSLSFAAWQSGHHPLRLVAELYVDVLRGIPMLVVILYVGFPLQGAIRDATGGFIDMSRLTRGVVGISLGYSAYMAEIFRAGIEAIGKGQTEAARSLGLSTWQTARFVVLPQALRIVVPLLGNEFIAMLKDTSLLSVLSVRDITQRAREFQAADFEVFPPFNTAAVLYIVLTLMASSLAKTVERRTSWNRCPPAPRRGGGRLAHAAAAGPRSHRRSRPGRGAGRLRRPGGHRAQPGRREGPPGAWHEGAGRRQGRRLRPRPGAGSAAAGARGGGLVRRRHPGRG